MSLPVRAGLRDQMITIQAPPPDVDQLGHREDAPWTTVCTAWARKRTLRSSESFRAGAIQVETMAVFEMPYRSGITSAMRLMWRGLPFGIVGDPDDLDGGRHTLTIYATSGVKDGR